jgi:hypothetical protein
MRVFAWLPEEEGRYVASFSWFSVLCCISVLLTYAFTAILRLDYSCAVVGYYGEWILSSSANVSLPLVYRHLRDFCIDCDSIWAVCAAVSTVSSEHILLVNNYRKDLSL